MSGNTPHNVLPSQAWGYQRDGDYYLLDPVSGKEFDPNCPPDFLLTDERLRSDEDVIHDAGQVALNMFYTWGESAPDDAGPEFESLVYNPLNRVNILGHTVDGTIGAYRDERRLVTAATVPAGASAYIQRLLRNTDTGIATFSAGLEVNEDGEPVTSTEATLKRLAQMTSEQADDRTDKGGKHMAMNIISESHHQWYRALRARQQIGEIIIPRLLDRDVIPEAVVIAAPTKDADYSRKFARLGMIGGWLNPDDQRSPTLEPLRTITDPAAYDDNAEQDEQAMQRGYIARSSLRR